ncbi:DUF4169 family protein [Blastochloris viridis]
MLRHGRTKAERAIEETRRERAVRDLDAHKREGCDADDHEKGE